MAIVVIGDTKTWHSPLIVGALLANEQHVVTFFIDQIAWFTLQADRQGRPMSRIATAVFMAQGFERTGWKTLGPSLDLAWMD
jgi:hypothetical protein